MIYFLVFLFAMLQLAFVYGFYRLYLAYLDHAARLTRLETRHPIDLKRKLPESVQPGLSIYPPIENFTPKKPETLRPNQVRGRDIQGVENVIEFDVKI
jgi:hypothetical protein